MKNVARVRGGVLGGVAVGFFGAIVACGGAATSIDDPLADASTTADGSAPAPVPSSSTSASVDGGGVSDAAPGDGATTPDGATADRRIDPIVVGRSWTYSVKVLGFYPACQAGTHVSTAKSSAQRDGKTAITVSSLCKNAGDFDYAVEGDRVFSYLAGWRLSLDAPVAEGHRWSDGARQYEWQSRGTRTVPAGTFDDCWSATVVASYTSYTVFCRGVGPIEWHYEDGLGNGYEATLTAKSF